MNGRQFEDELYELEYGVECGETQTPPVTGPVGRKDKPRETQAGMNLHDWLQSVVAPVVIGILIFTFVGNFIGVDGGSMLDTLHDRDIVVISKLFYTPHYGDIVIIDSDAFEKPIVKRVIATEGQTIDIDFESGAVSLDGHVIEEDYIRQLTMSREGFQGPYTVPDGCVFVMGDNRNESADSRAAAVGAIDTRRILGKVLFLLIPGEDAGSSRQWDRFGSVYR